MVFARVLILAGLLFQSGAMAAIHRDTWVANFQEYFLESICSESGPLNELAQKTSQANCVAKVSLPLRNCLDDLDSRIPNTLDGVAGSKLGRDLGRCTAEKLAL